MRRRDFALTGLAVLGMPSIAQAQQRELRFIPQNDLPSVDPVFSSVDAPRNHGFMVFDTLYGLDANYIAQPQMVDGAVVSADGRLWELTLRDGLVFHDGTAVLARDAVASIRRWGSKDPFGRSLMAAVDELSAPSDRLIRFRLKRPFPLLPTALANTNSMCCIMPERLARTPATTQVSEVVGSGPFRFLADELVTGSRIAYAKFDRYVPRASGTASFAAGPKIVHMDRVVWTVIPDSSTAASAMTNNEQDWWENPTIDQLAYLRRSRDLRIAVTDTTGQIGVLRFNHLHAPFNSAEICRLVLGCLRQDEIMAAYAGEDPSLIKTGMGLFAPASPMFNDGGTAAIGAITDLSAMPARLKAAGYRGEKVVFLSAQDSRNIGPTSIVIADTLRRMGFNVDFQTMDWGTVVQRRSSRAAPDQGGWSTFNTFSSGLVNILPSANTGLATGPNGYPGWWTAPDVDQLLAAWYEAPDLAAQQAIARRLQEAFLQNPAYAPCGMYLQPTCFNRRFTGIPDGFPVFWGVRPA